MRVKGISESLTEEQKTLETHVDHRPQGTQ